MVAPSKAFAFFGRRHIEWVKYWEMPSPKTSLFTTPWMAKMLWWWGNEKYGLSVGGKYWQMSTPKTFPSIAVEQKSERSQESAILDKSHFPHHYINSCSKFPLEWKSWSPTDLFNKFKLMMQGKLQICFIWSPWNIWSQSWKARLATLPV